MSLPSFFHGVGLHGGGYDAAGVTVPAGPGLVIGRTANAAWTLTSGITDNTDVYIEELNPSDPKQYLYKGRYRQMDCRNEVFNPAGQPSQTIEICRTAHGPVFASYPGENIAFSRDLYFFGRETKAAAQLVSLGFAPTFRKFQSTINKLEASLNCMYADNSGTIAYFHRGLLPVRPASVDPRLPLSGTGDDDVVGFVKGRHLPTAVNPPLGYIAQWNNKPIQGWPADEQRELWGGADRVQILIDQLAAAKAVHHPITSTDVVDYMKKAATSDIFAPRVAPYLRTAVDALPPATVDLPQLDAATDLIESWLAGGASLVATGASIPNPGVTIYRAWRVALQSALFGDELGVHNRGLDYTVTRVNDNADSSGDLSSPDAVLLRALDWPTAAFPTSRDYFMNVNTMTNPGRDATLVESLRTAITTLTVQYGTSDPSQWITPKITVQFDTTSAAPFLYGQTIIEREDRGSINQVVELLPTPVAQLVLPPGETAHIPPAGFPEPPHLRDQVGLYEGFGFHSNPNTLADLEGPTTTQTITLPY
jgi:penicillin amidase